MTWIPKDRAPRRFVQKGRAVRQGQLVVYTGDGKGKTTAALGLVFRALGYGHRVAVVQFIKGRWRTGEGLMAKQLAGRLDWFALGDGFTWITQNYEQDVASARRAWAKCLALLADPRYAAVILDELNCVLAYNFLDIEAVLAGLARRPPTTHVVVTGRDAPEALIAAADLVTEMKKVKHPYDTGLKAQPGLDY